MIAEALLPLACRVDSVRPMKGNPRIGNVEAVMRSLEEFGQRKPIVATADGTITAGHHLHAAAVQLGWDEVAVLFIDEDASRARAFALADNRTSDLGRYDNQALVDMLVAVREDDLALLAATSYSEEDVDDLLSFLEAPTPTDDDPPESEDSTRPEVECPNCGHRFEG